MSFSFANYGNFLPGATALAATGNSQATALPLPAQINLFSSVPNGAGCMLPQAQGSNTLEISVLNRGVSALSVYPPVGGQIETLGVNTPYSVSPSTSARFHCFDPPMAPGQHWSALAELGQASGGPFLALAGGTMGGPITLSGNAVNPLHAVPLQQLNAAVAGGPFLPTAGGTLTGGLTGTTANFTTSLQSPVLILATSVNLSWSSPSIIANQPFASASIGAGRNLTISPATAAIAPALNGLVGQLSGTVSGQSDIYRFNVGNDNMAGSGVADGIVKTMGIYHTVNGAAVAQGRCTLWTQLNVNNGPTISGLEMQGTSFQVFCNQTNPAVQPYCQPFCASGGVNAGATAGSFCNEIDYYAAAGSTVGTKQGLQITISSGDKVAGTTNDAGLAFTNANRATDNSPGMRFGIMFGADVQGFPVSPTGTMIGVRPEIGWKGSGRTAAFIPSQAFAGVDLQGVNFTLASGFAFRSSGFSVNGAGVISAANAVIAPISGGVKLDIPNQIVTAVAVSAGGGGGGSGTNDYYVGDTLFDANGGQYRVATVSSGAVATVTLLSGGVAASPPSNPVSTSGGSGLGCTLTLTWSAANSLSLNPTGQRIGFNGTAPVAKPTVTGAKGSNAALASLMTALAAYGLVTDSTSA